MSDTSNFPYLHGFSNEEQQRLRDQAQFNEFIIYQDIDFSSQKHILEVGCGVGAQTEILLRRFPELNITGVDLNDNQLKSAREHLAKFDFAKERYDIQRMNAEDLNFKSNQFDGAFLCWILEHVPSPQNVLSEVRRVLSPGSKIVITEVLNSSFFLEPYSPNLWRYWMAFNDFQLENAGDPFVGAKLGNLLLAGGYQNIQTSVKTLFYDNRFPQRRKETIEFWSNLLMSAKEQLISNEIISEELANKAHAEITKVARDPNAVFYYSFIQASATVL